MEFSLELPEQDYNPDDIFTQFGRAVYLALRFEEQCSGLAFLAGFPNPQKVLSNETQMGSFAVELENRLREPNLADSLQFLRSLSQKSSPEIQKAGSTDLLNKILNKARKARNELLHSPGPFFPTGEVTPEMDSELFHTALVDLAGGHRAVVLLASGILQNPITNFEQAQSYPEDVLSWVLGS